MLEISYGYENDSLTEDIFYIDEVYDFIDKVQNSGLIPACPDFIEDFETYSESSGEEEE